MEQNTNKSRTDIARKIKAEIIRDTVIPVCKIKLTNDDCTVFDSKVGGLPYLPHGGEFPTDRRGSSMYLLAQINFEEFPELEGFPNKGILQFFMTDGDFCRSDYDNPTVQENWRVIYHSEIDQSVDSLEVSEFVRKIGGVGYYCPSDGEYKMKFELSSEEINPHDFRFEKMFVERWNIAFPDEMTDSIYKLRNVPKRVFFEDDSGEYGKHKIGGYPYFTQIDPRHDEKYDTLLFQLDSENNGDVYVMCGDSGVINFFINHEALENLDFSDVLFSWDCC